MTLVTRMSFRPFPRARKLTKSTLGELSNSFDVFAVLVVRAGARAEPPCRPP